MAGKPGCNRTHGMSKTPTYQSWRDMKLRCTTLTDERYHHYRELGITVCDEWLNSFEAFLADMGVCPPGLTLDRIRGNEGYHKGNCRWATRAVQAENRTESGFVKMNIERAMLMRARRQDGATYEALQAEFGVSAGTVGNVLANRCWT